MAFRGVHVFKPQPGGGGSLNVSNTSDRVALPGAQPTEVRLSTEDADDPIFFEFGGVTVAATTAAGHWLRGGATEIFRVPHNATHIAAITASGTATLRISSGEGGH